jgi:UDP-2,3-diacylglucosamine pyrophosphatase LpxH
MREARVDVVSHILETTSPNGETNGNGTGRAHDNGSPRKKKTKTKGLNGKKKLRCRAAWVSDLHAGTWMFQALLFLALLKRLDFDELYIDGDALDIEEWQGLPQLQVDVLQKLLRKARKGKKITYVTGNHDQEVWRLLNVLFGKKEQYCVGKNIRVMRQVIHTTADGRKLLVLHGDQFDEKLKISRWVERLGNRAYSFSMWLDRKVNGCLEWFGWGPIDVAGWLKRLVKRALQHVEDFETLVAEYASAQDVQGIVSGHIHTAEIRRINGVLYVNCGAWVTPAKCTVVVEGFDGRLTLYLWTGADFVEIAREPEELQAMVSSGAD